MKKPPAMTDGLDSSEFRSDQTRNSFQYATSALEAPVILPKRKPFIQFGDNTFRFLQEPHHRDAVEIIADESDLKKPDIFKRGLLFCKHDGVFGVSNGVITIKGIALQNGVVFVSGDGGPVTRISSTIEVIEDERAEILRRLLHEFLEAIS